MIKLENKNNKKVSLKKTNSRKRRMKKRFKESRIKFK